MTTLELRFLGGLAIHQAGRPMSELKSQKGKALLCFLALSGKAHGRSALAGLLWPEMPEDNALMNLRVVLSKLNDHLAPHLAITRQTIAWNQNTTYWLDVAAFEAGLAARADIGRVQAAVALYQGDFLEGFDLDDAPQFEGWVLGQRARLREAALAALRDLVTHFSGRGDYEMAITYVRQLLAIEPWLEEAHRDLMRLLTLSGQRSAALVQYETSRRILSEELGVEPDPATVDLYRQIKEGRVTDARGLAPTVARIAAPPPTNLPTPPTSFIGRDEEVEEVVALLNEQDVRLLTLTGAGGSGKTRLAIAAAGELVGQYQDGVWWVELAALEEEELVPQAIARSLGLIGAEDQPMEVMLTKYLTDKRLLLVEDNCEHLVEECARLAEQLLSQCRHIQILATSREPLSTSYEHIWAVPTLACPDPKLLKQRNGGAGSGGAGAEKQRNGATIPEVIANSAAVNLFVNRAAIQRPGFRLTADNASDIAEICCRLDGIPLALELAAARVKILTPQQMTARFDHLLDLLSGGVRTAPTRHQTLRAAINWSHNLLEPGEQLLFRRLAAFRGGWTSEAVEAVCIDKEESAPVERPEIEDETPNPSLRLHPSDGLDLLGRLVDKSLVYTREVGGEMRFEMLETIYAYARERLHDTVEVAAVNDRHMGYYLNFVEQAERHIIGPQQVQWLDRMEREHDNIRAALRRSLGSMDENHRLLGVRLVGALEHFWYRRNWAREGMHWIEQAVAVMPANTPSAIQARLFRCAGTIVFLHGEPERAGELHARALAAFQAAGDPVGVAMAMDFLSVQLHLQGRLEQAIALSMESVDLARRAGAQWVLSNTLASAGWHYLDLQDPARAEPFVRESVELSRAVGDDTALVLNLNIYAAVVQEQGRPEEAAALTSEAVLVAQRLGDVRALATARQAEGHLQQQREEWAQAITSYRESLTLLARTSDMGTMIETMEGLAVALIEQGHVTQGVVLLAAITAHRESTGFVAPSPPYQLRQQAAILKRVPAEMGEAAFAAAWSRGKMMTLDQAVVLALQASTASAK